MNARKIPSAPAAVLKGKSKHRGNGLLEPERRDNVGVRLFCRRRRCVWRNTDGFCLMAHRCPTGDRFTTEGDADDHKGIKPAVLA